MKKDGRCTGHCCKSFGLRFEPNELQRLAEESRKKKIGEYGKDVEIEKVASMVLHLGQFQTNPLMKLFEEPWALKGLRIAQRADMLAVKEEGYDYNGTHWYACRHLLPNGDCGVYGDDTKRPKLCDTYPNGDLCRFEDCTMPLRQQVKQLHEHNMVPAVRELERRNIVPPRTLLRKRDEQRKSLMHLDVAVESLREAEDPALPTEMKARSIPMNERRLRQRPSMKMRVSRRT